MTWIVTISSFFHPDIDECKDPAANKCGDKGGTCANTIGGHTCICPAGYLTSADGKSCEDEDECATGRNNCDMECFNTEGSFQCMCPVGFKKVGLKCEGENRKRHSTLYGLYT